MMANNHNDNPFADYLWMGEMERFDEEVEAELEDTIKEEEFIKSCIEQLLDEEEEQTVYFENAKSNALLNGMNGHINQYHDSNQQVPYVNGVGNLTQEMGSMYIEQNGVQKHVPTPMANGVSKPLQTNATTSSGVNSNSSSIKSTLNPNAAPFFFNPNAQVFIPRSFTTRPTNFAPEQASHTTAHRSRHGR